MVADPGAAPGLQAYETCLALCVPALALGEGLEPSMSRATTGGLTFWLPEIVVGTDGVEPSSSGLQPDARAVAAAFPNAISLRFLSLGRRRDAPIAGACETGPTARRVEARRSVPTYRRRRGNTNPRTTDCGLWLVVGSTRIVP